jgi:vacuolar-type H+-ATPase subunit H
MALELMEQIKAAELKADNERARAQRDGREIVKSVEEACLEQERAAQQDARQLYQQAMSETRGGVEKEIASHGAQKRSAAASMTAAAEKNVAAAARLVFERIVNDGHR